MTSNNRHVPLYINEPMSFGKKFSTNNLQRQPSPGINKNRSNTNLMGNLSYMKSVNTHSQDSSFNIGAVFNESEVFPQDILILLSEEANNIQNFKIRIQKEKKKVMNDFEVFKQEINHVIQDLKSSMTAQLDLVYKTFIEKYAFLKSQVQQIRRIKKQIKASNCTPEYSYISANCSNIQMVREIEKQTANFRQYKISQYVQQLQKNKLNPLVNLTKQIILILSSQVQFYHSQPTIKELSHIKLQFNHFTNHMFENIQQYIRYLSFFSQSNNNNQQEMISAEVSKQSIKDFQQITLAQEKFQPQTLKKKKLIISQTQQNAKTQNIQRVTFKPFKTIKLQHSDTVLCCIIIANKYIATGGKDGTIHINTIEGAPVVTLRGHEASICTLAIIQSLNGIYLASGSDHKCCSVILWDTRNWTQITKLKTHTAAVSGIVDLGDNQTLISGSYDKKMNVCNYKKGVLLYNLPNNKSSIISLIINNQKDKLISCSLDSYINIWNISRDKNGIVQSINLERIIKNNFPLFALNSSKIRNDLLIAGSKDGKVKFWNIFTGQCERTLSVVAGPIVDLLLIQRDSKPNHPIILSCSTKDSSFVLTRSDTGINEFIEANLQLQFGGGVGPKVVFFESQKGLMLCVTRQNNILKQVNLHEINLY